MEEVKTYIRYITDRRLLQLGLKTNFKVKNNPLPWLEWILNGADHTNFFENRVTEYVDHLHEHFKEPVIIRNAAYMPPKNPGYSITMKKSSIKEYSFPNGKVWTTK